MKSLTKKVLGTVSALSLSVLVACGGGADQQAEQTEDTGAAGEAKTLQVGITLAEDSHYYKGLEHFADLVEEKTDGELTVEIFPNGSLGGERDMVESLQVGTLDMVLSSTGPLGGFAPEINVVDLPFLFESREHAYNVLDGEIGQNLLANLEGQSLKGLAWWENGFRHVTNSKQPIEKPEDLQGLKIRTMENNVHMDSFKALGADPTPMSFTELFTAMQQGVVDGQENPIPIISTSRFYEVQDYLTLTGHFYSPAALLVSTQVFDGLTEEQQKALQEAAAEGAKYEREIVAEMEEEMIADLKEQGMQIVENVDKKAFQEATKSVYDQYADQVGADLIKQIQDAAK
ncbi:TRAP transporter substrate-binding protein [Bacillus taeanensis]|uniref:C4-dicarboxylate ABC transporter substrate-binding protein n=1 Tax=Bacillus taeanensis TaxID=273032 RepID=A0A366XT88_9BACI|nr:TRAP transporter substrate-binding protein [Bacillus taeanensis]RBW67959.1 C4-dicarboxylate ABC transporter substrate-binding protein [Bacillus taeanensis]